TGRVTDAAGEPLAGITVQLQRSVYDAQGKRTFQGVVNARTNDLGEYRLYWVTPGLYFLSAGGAGSYLQNLMQSAASTAAGTAAAQDPNAAGAAQSAIESLLGVNRNEVADPGFATTFFPGTTESSRAVSIDVRPGTELR